MIDKDFEQQMEWVELILQEADRYGIRWEVQQTADTIILQNPDKNIVDAYQDALVDWDCVG